MLSERVRFQRENAALNYVGRVPGANRHAVAVYMGGTITSSLQIINGLVEDGTLAQGVEAGAVVLYPAEIN